MNWWLNPQLSSSPSPCGAVFTVSRLGKLVSSSTNNSCFGERRTVKMKGIDIAWRRLSPNGEKKIVTHNRSNFEMKKYTVWHIYFCGNKKLFEECGDIWFGLFTWAGQLLYIAVKVHYTKWLYHFRRGYLFIFIFKLQKLLFFIENNSKLIKTVK